ncbi:hypothetical protein D9M71_299260 [compost metagenome]
MIEQRDIVRVVATPDRGENDLPGAAADVARGADVIEHALDEGTNSLFALPEEAQAEVLCVIKIGSRTE